MYGLLIAEKILDEIDLDGLVLRYKAVQSRIIEEIEREFGLGLSASDAFLLAKLSAAAAVQLAPEQREMIDKFRRGDWYRFCLTPYFLEHEGK